MKTRRRRKLLSRDADLATRYRVYEVTGGLEVDEISFIETSRRRVFFDEVVLVTYHRYRSARTLWLAVLWAALFLSLAALAYNGDAVPLAWTLALVGAFAALVFLLAAVNPRHAITVFGLRNRARIVRRLGGRRARELYARLCREIAAAQRAARGAVSAGAEAAASAAAAGQEEGV